MPDVIEVLFVTDARTSALNALTRYFIDIPSVELDLRTDLPADLSPYDTVFLIEPEALAAGQHHELMTFVQAGGTAVALSLTPSPVLPDWFGVHLEKAGPTAELRVAFSNANHPMSDRFPKAFNVIGRHQPLKLTAEAVETILYADWQYTRIPVMTLRPVGEGRLVYSTLAALELPLVRQLYHRLLRYLNNQMVPAQPFRVGILGYSREIRQLHVQGFEQTKGLDVRAVCDPNHDNLRAAQQQFDDLSAYTSPQDLASSSNIDVVFIATPPNSHPKYAIELMEEGKHVVCAPPLALTRVETSAMMKVARRQKRVLCCHQIRRWDVDYLAIRQALSEGLVGQPFYLETFVGGYHYPDVDWSSHQPMSGGKAYEWGAHYLDWILALMPDPVVAVIGTRHKRVWHTVTNADQERIQMRFANGQEAEFIHSEIAAYPKPKWYILGTEGAIIGHWEHLTSYRRDPAHHFHRRDMPETEIPPRLTARIKRGSEQLVEQVLTLPAPQAFPFHHNLADHLLLDEPLVASLQESARVVAVLEAATRSAERDGTEQEVYI